MPKAFWQMGCMLFFGLIFLAPGAYLSGTVAKNLFDHTRAGFWRRVPVTIESVELESEKDPKGHVYYTLRATYSYYREHEILYTAA